MSEVGTDYNMAPAHAEWLSGTICLPIELRILLLRKFVASFSQDGLIEAFAHFMGLANSVAANAAEMCSMQRIMDGMEHPDRMEDRVNMPTPFGALQGVLLASKVSQEGICSTCAFRLGSAPNQSPITTCDADWCSHPGEEPFMCHEDMDERGRPTKACVGFARLRATRKAAT